MSQTRNRYFDPAMVQEPVISVQLAAYGNEGNIVTQASQPPTNSWAMFLEIGKKRSIMIEMWPDVNLNGSLIFESRRYVGTYNSVKTLELSLTGQPVVQIFFDIIYKNGRDRFRFTEHKEGCRHWLLTVTSDLEDSGILESGAKSAAWEVLSMYWHHPPGTGSNAREMREGTFY